MRKNINIFLILALTLPFFVDAQEGTHQNKTKNNLQVEKLEDNILDTILKIPKVVRQAKYVEDVSKGSRHLADVIYKRPTNIRKYYWVKVWEDNGMSYVTHFNFFVYPKDMSIRFFDTINDKVLSLETWQKIKE